MTTGGADYQPPTYFVTDEPHLPRYTVETTLHMPAVDGIKGGWALFWLGVRGFVFRHGIEWFYGWRDR